MHQRIVYRLLVAALAALWVVVGFPSPVLAHVDIEPTSGLSNGLAHPVTGLDHILAMVAVGLWAAQRGGRAIWLVPLAFVTVMAAGGILGMAAISIPYVEQGIVASVLVIGVLIASAVRLPLVASMILVGLFALFHGHSHGAEMPDAAAGLAYGIGFILATSWMHSVGIGLGLLARRLGTDRLVRYAGGAIAASGIYLCLA